MSNASTAFLAGGGAPSAKFGTFGDAVTGTVTEEPRVEQQRDYDSGKPLTYDDGNPRMQMVVTVQTQLRDPSIKDDDGQRRLFVRTGLRAAVQKAVQKAGVDTIEVGGELTVAYTHDDGRAKQYQATYTPPKGDSAAFLAAAPAPAAAAEPAAASAEPAAAAPAGLPEGVTPEALQGLKELGMIK